MSTVAGRASAGATAPASLLILAAIAVTVFLSLNFNLFRVVPQDRFVQPTSVSEKLIVDAIAHAERTGDTRFPLGHLVTPDAGGQFRPYLSQYGLQAVVWRALNRDLGLSIDALRSTNAVLMALMVAGLCAGLMRQFGWRSAVAAGLAYALTPWFVMYSRDLYWISWIWLAPAALGFAAGHWMYRRGSAPWLFLLVFAMAMFVKLASGYEYVSTIALAAAAPVAYFGLRDGVNWRGVLARLIAMALATLLAAGVALGLHMSRFESTNEASGRIANLVSKRLYGADPQQVAVEACESEVWAGDDCVATYVQSLQANPLVVVARYFVARDVLPWLGGGTDVQDSAELKAAVAQFKAAPTAAGLRQVADKVDGDDLRKIANSGATAIALIGLAMLATRRVLRLAGPSRLAWAALLALSAAAPLSWFVLAKGHSYIHLGLNMVLWYVTYIPVALSLVLACAPAGGTPDKSGARRRGA